MNSERHFHILCPLHGVSLPPETSMCHSNVTQMCSSATSLKILTFGTQHFLSNYYLPSWPSTLPVILLYVCLFVVRQPLHHLSSERTRTLVYPPLPPPKSDQHNAGARYRNETTDWLVHWGSERWSGFSAKARRCRSWRCSRNQHPRPSRFLINSVKRCRYLFDCNLPSGCDGRIWTILIFSWFADEECDERSKSYPSHDVW